MFMIFMVALIIQLVLFFIGQAEWFEPIGIFVAIIIANGVASVSESKQEGKAIALKAEEEAMESAKVIRSGDLTEVHVSQVVVGDIVFLQAGDKVPADSEVISGNIKVDQASSYNYCLCCSRRVTYVDFHFVTIPKFKNGKR